MISDENKIIAAGLLATVIGLLLLGAVEVAIGFPGEWVVVLAFVLVVFLGFVLPQVYLSQVDRSTPRISRMGVITLMMIVLAAVFSGSVSGMELAVIWGIVGVSIGVVFLHEGKEGYRDSTRSS